MPALRSSLALCLLLAAADPAAAASVSLDEPRVVLGRTESVAVTLKVDEPPGAEDRPLRVAVNVGSFSEVTRVAPGVYRTVYVPPPTRFPQVALVAVWRETGPLAKVSYLRIPLYGTTQVPVKAPRNAEVVLSLEGEQTPPQKVGRAGNVSIPVAVPPGVTEAKVTVRARGKAPAEQVIPVEVPPYNRLTTALVPHAIVADGKAWARLEVFYDLGGADVPPSRIRITPSSGKLTFQRAEQGRYVYRFDPPPGAAADAVDFKVTVEGDPQATASARLKLGLLPPQRLVLRPPAEPIPADGQSEAPVQVLVFDREGLGLPASGLTVTANGTPLQDVRYLGDGLHEVAFPAPARFPAGGLVQFVATVARLGQEPLRAGANYQLLTPTAPQDAQARFRPGLVPADGRTAARVVIELRDEAGMPLSNAQVMAVASHGTVGPLSQTGPGEYEATYVAPAELPAAAPVMRLVDVSGAFERNLHIPLRLHTGRAFLGVRGGYAHTLGSFGSLRGGIDAHVPVRLGGAVFGVGVSALYGQAEQTVHGGAHTSVSRVQFVPVTLRLGYEAWASQRLSLNVGGSGTAAFARFGTSLTGEQTRSWGLGGGGFLGLSYAVGPGQFFTELGYGAAPVRTLDFRLEAGGATVELGYRFGVL
jgi:hypothetical protein